MAGPEDGDGSRKKLDYGAALPQPDSREMDELANDAIQPQAKVSSEDIVSSRHGKVLNKNTILKSDHFPGCQNLKLTPLLDGAPNFRQVPGLPVYGVAIPTVKGLRTVLDVLGAGRGGRKVLWHNMREEPVIYVNGNPYVVREADNPLANLEYTGINRNRVEQMEIRLKEDILDEAANMQNTILCAGEDDNFNVIDQWESVTEVDVQTPLEVLRHNAQTVYAELQADGYDVDYLRVPVTDEKAPKEKDCDELVRRCWNTPPGSAVVFNCQMGRGRTTTGMIICSLLLAERLKRTPDGAIHLPKWYTEGCGAIVKISTPEEELKAGMYDAVRSLMRVLDEGNLAKLQLDAAIDACASMQNLREAIGIYRGRMLKEQKEHKRDHLLTALLQYLERYCVLIAFTAYLGNTSHFSPGSINHRTFEDWWANRPEIESILDRMVTRNPFAALGIKRTRGESALRSALKTDNFSGMDDNDSENAKALLHIANRKGSVLGSHTILKVDHWPGMQSKEIPPVIDGAPNFRALENAGVYASALPTVEGICRVLETVGAGPSSNSGKAAVWHNMREEPVVYINGCPFVLRESARPFKNMQEYTGIDPTRLEQMEQRLKEDIIAEAKTNGNLILVSQEKVEEVDGHIVNRSSELKHMQESIQEGSVKVPAEVYADLCAEGYKVKYFRIPVTDGNTPEDIDLDRFSANLAGEGDAPLVFNCQMGLGRSTIGMIVGCMLKLQVRRVASVDDLLGLLNGVPSHTGLEQMDYRQLAPAEDEVMDHDVADSEATHYATKEEDAMMKGDYVAIRKLIRGLEQGDAAKATADKIINKCAKPINLRLEIMNNLQTHQGWEYHRHDELQARRTNFKRGASYLHRYWTVIAYAAYKLQQMDCQQRIEALELEDENGLPGSSPITPRGSKPLESLQHRLRQTFAEWLRDQPELTMMRKMIKSNPAAALVPVVQQTQVPLSDIIEDSAEGQSHVPIKRQHDILSSRRGANLHKNTILKTYYKPSTRRYAQVLDLPVYTIGNPGVENLMSILRDIGCGPGGNNRAVITDICEELTVYVKGQPYVRRELEMPVAALHHAGIGYSKLQEMEFSLAHDVVEEIARCHGRLLIHRELENNNLRMSRPSNAIANRLDMACSNRSINVSDYPEFDTPVERTKSASYSHHYRRSSASGLLSDEDEITKMFDKNPGAAVVGSWLADIDVEPGNPGYGGLDNGVHTTKQVFYLLRQMGYNVEYKRIPLSRDRTPVALDIEHLQLQLKVQQPGGEVNHIVMSRSMTGSSCRFVTAMLATKLLASPLGDMGEPTAVGSSPKRMRTGITPGREHRSIMNLLRALEFGPEAKEAVDEAINSCANIGDIREDIRHCWIAANNPESTLEGANEARQLGVHYLQRYALLLTFRVYLEVNTDPKRTFSEWYHYREELGNMIKSMNLY